MMGAAGLLVTEFASGVLCVGDRVHRRRGQGPPSRSPPGPHGRSRRPREVVREVYGLAPAQLASRLTLVEAACRANLDPDRLSFTGTLRGLRRAVVRFPRGRTGPELAPLW